MAIGNGAKQRHAAESSISCTALIVAVGLSLGAPVASTQPVEGMEVLGRRDGCTVVVVCTTLGAPVGSMAASVGPGVGLSVSGSSVVGSSVVGSSVVGSSVPGSSVAGSSVVLSSVLSSVGKNVGKNVGATVVEEGAVGISVSVVMAAGAVDGGNVVCRGNDVGVEAVGGGLIGGGLTGATVVGAIVVFVGAVVALVVGAVVCVDPLSHSQPAATQGALVA
jgi:hypothetical protein